MPARVVALVRELRAPHVASVGVVSHKSCALRSSFSAYTPSPAQHHHRPTALAAHQLVEATRSSQSLVPSGNALAQHLACELPSILEPLAPAVDENVIPHMRTQCTLQHSYVACYQPMTTLVRVSQACHNVSKASSEGAMICNVKPTASQCRTARIAARGDDLVLNITEIARQSSSFDDRIMRERRPIRL